MIQTELQRFELQRAQRFGQRPIVLCAYLRWMPVVRSFSFEETSHSCGYELLASYTMYKSL